MSWVRTSTALPSSDRLVLITVKTDLYTYVTAGKLMLTKRGDRTWYNIEVGYPLKSECVAAWSELPKAYKGDQK